MIIDALWAMLFGMAGIFLVMAIIFGAVVLLSRASAADALRRRRSTNDDDGATEKMAQPDTGAGA